MLELGENGRFDLLGWLDQCRCAVLIGVFLILNVDFHAMKTDPSSVCKGFREVFCRSCGRFNTSLLKWSGLKSSIAGLLKPQVATPLGVAKCNFGAARKLAWQIRYTSFCKLYKKTCTRAVNLFILQFYGQYRASPCQLVTRMSAWAIKRYQIIITQAQHFMRCYIMMILTYWPILTLLH